MIAGPIDLHHQAPGIVAAYLLQTDDGPALFDCGPTTCVPALKAGLSEQGLELTDLRHLLLSHIHLDHAGAAGVLVREHPGLQVHVSEVGAPHLVDPSKLDASARRLYGDAFDELWGELAPVPEANVHVVGDRVLGLDCFPTPGHEMRTRPSTRWMCPRASSCAITRKVCVCAIAPASKPGMKPSSSRIVSVATALNPRCGSSPIA